MKSLRRNRKGAILILSAVFAPVLIGIASFMIDIALAYSARNRLEQVAGYAAEIGSKRLPDTASAISIAHDMAEDMMRTVNIYSTAPEVTSTSDGSTVTIEIDVTSKSFFSKIYSSVGIDVKAVASRP